MSAVTLAVCPEHGLLPDQSKLDPSCECGRRLETVEYVPAEQLRGAVDLLRKANPHVKASAFDRVKGAQALADEIDAYLGGQ